MAVSDSTRVLNEIPNFRPGSPGSLRLNRVLGNRAWRAIVAPDKKLWVLRGGVAASGLVLFLLRSNYISMMNELSASESLFTSGQAARLGIAAKALLQAVASGRAERIAHGAYRLAGTPATELDRVAAIWKLTALPDLGRHATPPFGRRGLSHPLLEEGLVVSGAQRRSRARPGNLPVGEGVLTVSDGSRPRDAA